MQEVRTLGELIEQDGLLDELAQVIGEVNVRAGHEAVAVGRKTRLKVSCATCTATKGCCHAMVVARLYEGLVVAAQLRKEGRDTPELRAQLAEVASAMEAAGPYEWRRPCVFLGERDRCTVYASRPTPCGMLYVYTPPAACNDPALEIRGYVPHAERAVAMEMEERFRDRLSLRKKIGRRYVGVLPRMVLVALEMWDRSDFRDVLRAMDWPTDEAVAKWNPREPGAV